jgi:S-formylglutathione hydrolase FrmB
MALIHCNFFSEVIGLCSSAEVILPDPRRTPEGLVAAEARQLYPTLYLLHGLSDDHTIWQRRTSIERYVAELNLAVVMPAVQRSFYTDMARGYPYWTFVSEELPALMRAWFPLSAAREDNFVAGLSMGGYGAFKLALTHPDRFAAAASLSGALDVAGSVHDRDREWQRELRLIFGKPRQIASSPHDLFYLAEQLAESEWADLPLYQWCGTEDFLYDENLRFRSHARSLDLNLTYEEGPGVHEWGDWDRMIQRVLGWLPRMR